MLSGLRPSRSPSGSRRRRRSRSRCRSRTRRGRATETAAPASSRAVLHVVAPPGVVVMVSAAGDGLGERERVVAPPGQADGQAGRGQLVGGARSLARWRSASRHRRGRRRTGSRHPGTGRRCTMPSTATSPLGHGLPGRHDADALGPDGPEAGHGRAARCGHVAASARWRCRRSRPRTRWPDARRSRRGVPTCSMRPWLNTAMRSLIDSASSLVVGDEDERDPDLVLDRLQLDLHLLAQLQVEGAERLVEQQHLRTVDERAGQRDALALTAGELVGRRAAEVRRAARWPASPAPAGAARPCRPSSPSARTRRSPARSCAGRARSPGTPC